VRFPGNGGILSLDVQESNRITLFTMSSHIPASLLATAIMFWLASLPEATCQNILSNGNLENGTAGWVLYVAPDSVEKQCAFEVSKDDGRDGQTVKMTSAEGARYAISCDAPGNAYIPGGRYRLTFWIRAGEDFSPVSGTPAVYARVSMFANKAMSADPRNQIFDLGVDGRTAQGGDIASLVNPSIPAVWTKVEGVFEISPETQKLNVRIYVSKGSGTIHVDDVTLEPVDGGTSLTPL